MFGTQFRVLYRTSLFSVVDHELLSTRGTGDASRLLLQVVALLFSLGVCCCLAALLVAAHPMAVMRLLTAWSIEHFLIATTMLVVGLLTVLSWDQLFPNHRDVLVLGPLPIAAHTILLARVCAAVTALAIAVAAFHAAPGVVLPLALSRSSPDRTLHVPSFTYDAPRDAVGASELKGVLDADFADITRTGPLAPGAGGGVAIAIYHRGVRQVLTYGAAAPDSIYQIGSVTKPFTGLLLADMIDRGEARIDEPVRALIPAARLPRPPGNEITLVDLATHRSGLPGMPPGFRWSARPDPVAEFGIDTLYRYLHTRGLGRRPADSFVYSNIGFGLLGHALGERAGMDYASLLRERITGPLGMHDTAVELSPAQQRRLLTGYNDYRDPLPAWHFDVLAGAGGLSSTAVDLLAWLEANLHPERAPALSAAIGGSQQLRRAVNREFDIALAWVRSRDEGAFIHTGALLGFTSDVWFNPARDLAVVVLANVGPGTAWSADSVAAHVRARVDGRPAHALAEVAVPPTGGMRAWARRTVAYWVTMAAGALFVFGFIASVQGLAAALLPRRTFVRISSWLQLALLCGMVAAYVLQPMIAGSATLVAAQGSGPLAWSPSYWFLGLFQELSGSPALSPLARKAWVGLTAAIVAATAAYTIAYGRTLRQIAEQPDVATTAAGRLRWPAFSAGPHTAIVDFALKTVARSATHRMILAFYWGLGVALIILVLKVPRGQQEAEGPAITAWDETGVPLILASVVTMAFAVLAARLAFAMPRDLAANWIFRMTPLRSAREYMSARRTALIVAAVAPVWAGWAMAFLAAWPWPPALKHLLVLAVLGIAFAELALTGPLKLPCTCSYLPGKSQLHLVFVVALLLFAGLVLRGARYELDVLQNTGDYALLLAALAAMAVVLRLGTALAHHAAPMFDQEGSNESISLALWDSRLTASAGSPGRHEGRPT